MCSYLVVAVSRRPKVDLFPDYGALARIRENQLLVVARGCALLRCCRNSTLKPISDSSCYPKSLVFRNYNWLIE